MLQLVSALKIDDSREEDLLRPYEIEIARVALGSGIRKDKMRDGTELWNYFLEGVLRMRATIRNGMRHGGFQLFYSTGLVWIQGSYKDDRPVDDWETFLPNGEKFLVRK
jgi:antitoxin component YwqK of YwqJK toxin-antitoxin module